MIRRAGRGLLAALLGCGIVAGPVAAAPQPAVSPPMVRVDAGTFKPLYRSVSQAGPTAAAIPVAAFLLDAYAVTNAQFLTFVDAEPRWRRSLAPRVFVDEGYLAHWQGDTELGPAAPPQSPVTRVSWFAARAYCRRQGKTLPSTEQWEYAASAGATLPSGEPDPAFLQMILDWYSQPMPSPPPPVGSGFLNAWGVHDLHGLVWEWTLDFNTALITGESRADAALERGLYCGSGAVGASNFRDYGAFLRYGFRASLNGNYAVGSLGFRCAAELDSPSGGQK